ncbi:xylose isomerase [Methanoculleus sp. Wushi-C6]|uniref:Xylose isomerase n=1 Tax=Methanoculleus caldifontis TaxID=2651577 RepID=A0ABU3X0H1_9EURY|nr:TIM barrel protein [Methanoculleus sp. Wushi-C6]MDV2481526.1 xylose isomerase [Methanoculleus sp. Wushi-C6]
MAGYNLGCTVRLDDPGTLALLSKLHDSGAIHHIQIQAVPLPRPLFRQHLEEVAATGIPTVIHAPHHGHGVNPCAPQAYDDRPLPEIEAYIEEAICQTFEAADTLGAETIVLHAGRYEPGGRSEAAERFTGFLDRHNDPRFTLENLPSVYAGYPLLGNTAGELTALAERKITRFCLDFPHLACTANHRGLSFAEELERFEGINVTYHHLSNLRRGSITDEHIELDHPDGGLDLAAVFSRLRRHATVPTALEYKQDSPEVYARQVRVFAGLWEGPHRG